MTVHATRRPKAFAADRSRERTPCICSVQVGASASRWGLVMPSDRIAGRLAPFAMVAFIAYVLSFAFGTTPKIAPLILSAGLTVLALGLPLCFRPGRMPRVLRLALPGACLVAVALLRWSAGGQLSGYGPLFMLPVLWVALYGSSAELAAALMVLVATLLTSASLVGAGAFAPAELRRTLLVVAVASFTGISVHRLVSAVRAKAMALREQTAALRDAERRARSARDLFAGVLRAATECAIIATDPDGIITVFNEGAQRMLGYDAGEMVGRRGLAALHLAREVAQRASQLGLEPCFEVFAEAPRYGIAETREWTYVRRDRCHLPVAATMTAMRNPNDEVTGFIVIATNITARRMEQARTRAIIATQAEIASAGHELNTVMERIAARALSLTGAAGATVEVPDRDEMVCALAAGSLASFVGMRLDRAGSLSGLCLAEKRILSSEDAALDPRVDRDSCHQFGARSMVAVPLRHKETVQAVLKVVAPLAHAFSESDIETLELLANLMGAALAHAEDYVRLAEANSRLLELDRLKDGFVATASHELRTPMASIIAYTEMLHDGDGGPLTPDQERMVSAVGRNSRRLLGLIEDLLALSEIESGALKTRRAPTELRPLVEAVGEALRPTAEAASVDLQVEAGDDVGTILADAAQLDRALMNVVANAIKFSIPSGRVDLRATRRGALVEIGVTDRGIGIAPQDQERMFERFFRAAGARERAIPGTGLGLAIVKEIVTRHGGEVSLESKLGEGTRVTLRLPAAAPDATADQVNIAATT